MHRTVIKLAMIGFAMALMLASAPRTQAAPRTVHHTHTVCCCPSPHYTWWYPYGSYEPLEYGTAGYPTCLDEFIPPIAEALLYNCTYESDTINSDAWLASGTVPGSTRYADSGRTGFTTYPGGCYTVVTTSVAGPGQLFTWPLYACSWHVDLWWDGKDWLCVGS